ncbi:BQ5605_C031g10969 [Microbotryum silenes-dioicae]|uniref:BQ5605_C031g10969 protein n=1 Tax=Microbotryum silenes-dioicae TaxID=796604 RepID=A0A2X0NAM4_9BASI|nr:BQ5605_C031g10969 [Microbotryum silenes-dioicae]
MHLFRRFRLNSRKFRMRLFDLVLQLRNRLFELSTASKFATKLRLDLSERACRRGKSVQCLGETLIGRTNSRGKLGHVTVRGFDRFPQAGDGGSRALLHLHRRSSQFGQLALKRSRQRRGIDRGLLGNPEFILRLRKLILEFRELVLK